MDKETVKSVYCLFGLLYNISKQEFVDGLDESEYMICSEILQECLDTIRAYTGNHPDILSCKNELNDIISVLKVFNNNIC